MLETLNVAQSGLNTSQRQVENVMNNIANEHTQGFRKRIVDTKEFEDNDGRMTGRGVYVNGVNRVTDTYIYNKLIDENSKSAQQDQLSKMLGGIEAIFTETDDSGLSYDLDRYFQALENLRTNPKNEIYRSDLASRGNILVDDIKSLYKDISNTTQDDTSLLKTDIKSVNTILKQIGLINHKIMTSSNITNALFDEREVLENKLAKYVPIKIDKTDDYLLTINGVIAVRNDDNINNLELDKKDLVQKDKYANSDNKSTLIDTNTWGINDSITYYLDKELSVTVKYGDSFIDKNGNQVLVNETNVVQALVKKINDNEQMSKKIVASNGQYFQDNDGTKIDQLNNNEDHFLLIESKKGGFDAKFDGKIVVNDDDFKDENSQQVSYVVEKNKEQSKKANTDIFVKIYDTPLEIDTAKFKSLLNNISTTSKDNNYIQYKEMLDDFSKALSDYSDSYIHLGGENYIYGKNNSLLHSDKKNRQYIGLFDGTSVDTLKFNANKVVGLSQNDLNYLISMQWNDNVKIGRDNEGGTSFKNYYERIRLTVSQDKENIDNIKEQQDSITKSLETNYDKLTKVNKDDEMVNLISFQSAYEANAKLITIVDEMLATILKM